MQYIGDLAEIRVWRIEKNENELKDEYKYPLGLISDKKNAIKVIIKEVKLSAFGDGAFGTAQTFGRGSTFGQIEKHEIEESKILDPPEKDIVCVDKSIADLEAKADKSRLDAVEDNIDSGVGEPVVDSKEAQEVKENSQPKSEIEVKQIEKKEDLMIAPPPVDFMIAPPQADLDKQADQLKIQKQKQELIQAQVELAQEEARAQADEESEYEIQIFRKEFDWQIIFGKEAVLEKWVFKDG